MTLKTPERTGTTQPAARKSEHAVSPAPKTAERQPRRKAPYAIGGGVLALLVAGGLFLLPKLANNESNSNVPEPDGPAATSVPNPGETEGNSGSTGEYMVPIESLADMSPEQLKALATISVESVTVDGKIDWNLYAHKLNDVMLLAEFAGTSPNEAEQIYNDSVDPSAYAAEYDNSLTAGFAAPEANLNDFQTSHSNNVIAAYSSYLVDGKPIVGTAKLIEDIIIIGSDETSANFNMTQHFTDNYFSSGAFSADSPRDTEMLGRDADLNVDITSYVRAEVEGDVIKLVLMERVS